MKKRFLILLIPNLLLANNKATLFGISARWEANEPIVEQEISNELSRMAIEGKEYLDPDCIWRKTNRGVCTNRFPRKTAELEKMAELYQEETQGYFDIRHQKDKRDFGGMWQGYALDQLRSVRGEWLVDLSGDILFWDQAQLSQPIIVTDPVFDEVEYARVEMPKGLVMASVGKKLEGKIVTPSKLTRPQEPIHKVVLFADPKMSAARLDAWSTAIIAGGVSVLRHLWTLEEFQGQWGYFFFDERGQGYVSSNVHEQKEGKTRILKINLGSTRPLRDIRER